MKWLLDILSNTELTEAQKQEAIQKELPNHFIPKDKYNSTSEELKELKGQLSERDKQLEELSSKAQGSEELQNQIKALQEQNKATQTEYEQKLQQQQFDFALDKSLSAAKVKNTKALKALLDMDTIKLDGENLKGLEEQLKAIKESDSYLFAEEQQQQKPQFTTGQHQTSGNSNDDPFAAKLAKYQTD